MSTNDKSRETPRTDAEAFDGGGWGLNTPSPKGMLVRADFARDMERELAEAHKALDVYDVARGAGGHSVRYRIGLLVEALQSATTPQQEAERRAMDAWDKSGIEYDLTVHRVLDELEALRRGVGTTYQTPADDPVRELRHRVPPRGTLLALLAGV
jgi:hypothetical protein